MRTHAIAQLLTIAGIATMFCGALVEATTVANNGFEDNSLGGVGYGIPSSWTGNGNTGVNDSSQPFLNQPPHAGSQVAFIQGAGYIEQTISGLDPTKTYSVTFWASERGQSGASSSTYISLDGGSTSQSLPADSIIKTNNFRRIVSGPLSVSGTSSVLRIGNPNGTGDDSLLIDSVSIARAAPRVSDGGFENAHQPGTGASGYKLNNGGGSGTLAGTSWTFTGPSGITTNGSSFTPPTAVEGSQAGILRGTETFTTTVENFEAGVTYNLSLEAAARGSSLGPTEFEITLGGVLLTFSSANSVTPGATTYTTYTTDDFTTTGGDLELILRGLTPGDKTTFIDDIRFNFVAEAVPETSTTLLGCLGLLLMLRRRR